MSVGVAGGVCVTPLCSTWGPTTSEVKEEGGC